MQDSDNLPQIQRDNTWDFGSSISRTIGRHTWKVGFQFTHFTMAYLQSLFVRGNFIFNGSYTSDPNNPNTTGDAFADFLLGYPAETQRSVGNAQAYLRQNTYAAFVQDDWRITPRISISAGLRYEYMAPFSEDRGDLLNLNYSTLPNVAKADVLRIGNFHRVGERLKRADHAIDVQKVRDRNVAGAIDLQRQREAALATLLLGLQRVDAPVGDIVHLHFVANVVFARHLVNAPLGGSVGHQHPRLCERAGRPDVEECAAAPVCDPEARILPVPAAIEIRVGRVRVVVRILTPALDARGAVTAQEAYVVHHRSGAGHPFRGHCPGVDAAGVEPDPDEYVAATLWRLDHRLGRAYCLERGCGIAQKREPAVIP